MKNLNNKSKVALSILLVGIGIVLIFVANKNFKAIDESITVKNQKYKSKIESVKLTDEKTQKSLDEIQKKIDLIDSREQALQGLVNSFNFEDNKYDDYISNPVNLDFNHKNILSIKNDSTDKVINSYFFNNRVSDAEMARINLLFSSILQNDYLIKEVNYNLLRSNLEAYKYNGILNYYNTTNNYFIKSKLKIDSKDKLMSLYKNMLVLKKLGLDMLDHLSYTNITDKKEVDFQAVKNQMNQMEFSQYNIPEKFTKEYYQKLMFGTDVYNIINSYSNYLNEYEIVEGNSVIKILRDDRKRVYAAAEISNENILNYYYDSSGKVFKVVDFTDGIQTIDLLKSPKINDRANEIYKLGISFTN